MTNLLFKKIIAKDGERELIDSSYEEMTEFISGMSRQDFMNSDVICIKFLISDNQDFKDAEETCWYINPEFCSKLSLYEEGEGKDLDIPVENCYPDYIFVTTENDAIKMPSNMLPELILMYIPGKEESIFEKYVLFEAELMRENLLYAPDSVKLEMFLKSIND